MTAHPVNPREVLIALQKRPQAYLVDDHYVAFVNFIQGLDVGTNESFLAGFNEWMAARDDLESPSISWPWQVVYQRFPIMRTDGRSIVELTAYESEVVTRDMFQLLQDFLSS